MTTFTETHAHIDDPAFDADREAVLERARAAGVSRLINLGSDLASSRASVELMRRHAWIWAAVGVHPSSTAQMRDRDYQEIRTLADDPRVVAIGEIGLDYYRDRSPRHIQQDAFRRQIRLARDIGKPLVVHDRDAHDDVLRILREEGADAVGGVMHCFSGGGEFARSCLDLGFYIALGGPVTFSNGQRAREAALAVPADRLLLETDCPYLAPVPHRGQRNEPAYLAVIAEQLARLKGMSVDELARQTSANADRLFGLC